MAIQRVGGIASFADAPSIRSVLEAHVGDGTLTLPADAFGAGPLCDMLRDYLPGTALVLTSVSLADDGDAVVASGTGGAAPFGELAVSARFSPAGASVGLTLTAVAEPGWTLSLAYRVWADSILDQLPVSAATLTLSSSAPASRRLRLEARFPLSGVWKTLGWLFVDAQALAFDAPVAIEHGVPVFGAEQALDGLWSFAVFKSLALSVRLASSPVEPLSAAGGPSWGAGVRFGLAARLPFPGVADGVPIFIDLTTPQSLIAIRADVTGVGKIALSALADAVNGADLGAQLPPASEYDPGTALALAQLDFTIDPFARKLASVDVLVGTGVDWPLAEHLRVTDITLAFSVTAPMERAARAVRASLRGAVRWAGGSLDFGASIPRATFFARLAPGARIGVAQVLDYFLPVKGIGGDLYVDELSMVTTPSPFSFSLQTAVCGAWMLDLGFVTAELQRASLGLDRPAGGAVAGTIDATAKIADIVFTGTWQLPGDLKLVGAFPDIDLDRLGRTLTGHGLPAGLAPISIVGARAIIETGARTAATRTRRAPRASGRAGAGRFYGFSLSASAKSGTTLLGSACFSVRKGPAGTGFIVGFAVPPAWSPASLFPSLGDLFGRLTFERAGLIVTTMKIEQIDLPNMTMPSLPKSVDKGVIAFMSLELRGDGIDLIARLFKRAVVLDLVAVIDVSAPVNSAIEASLPSFEINNAVTFKTLRLLFAPAQRKVQLTAALSLRVYAETVELRGDGTLTLSGSPALTLDVLIENWNEPFGIRGLRIDAFGLAIGVSAGVVDIGLLGRFTIGKGEDAFTLTALGSIIDFEAPGALGFGLKSAHRTLKITDLIRQFTDVDASDVPVLSDIGFRTLDFLVVTSPAGFTIGPETFAPGIRVSADVSIFEWDAYLDCAVNTGKGVYARGALSREIDFDGLFVIAAYDETSHEGPSFLIDTTAFTGASAIVRRDAGLGIHDLRASDLLAIKPATSPPAVQTGADTYLELSARVSLLGVIGQKMSITVSRETFDFKFGYRFLGLAETLTCSADFGKHAFAASLAVTFELHVDLPGLTISGHTVIPRTRIDGSGALLSGALSLALARPVTGGFALRLKFRHKGIDFDWSIDLTLADIGNALANLWQAIERWIERNAETVWKRVLASVEAFVAAIRAGLFSFGADLLGLARALVAAFDLAQSPKQLVWALYEIGYSFSEIAGALVKVIDVSYREAYNLIKSVIDQGCALTGADLALLPLPQVRLVVAAPPAGVRGAARLPAHTLLPAAALIELSGCAAGQRLLYHYYDHKDELDALFDRHPSLRPEVDIALRAAQAGGLGADRPVAAALIVLDRLQRVASPALAAAIDESRAMLAPLAGLGYAAFIDALRDDVEEDTA